jgi:hypothetical protein
MHENRYRKPYRRGYDKTMPRMVDPLCVQELNRGCYRHLGDTIVSPNWFLVVRFG